MVTLIIAVIVLIVVLCCLRGRGKSKSPNTEESEIDIVRGALLRELEKPEPDYERIKQLKEWENRLNTQGNGEMTRQVQATDGSINAPSNGVPDTRGVKSVLNTPVKITGLDVALYVGSLLILAGVGGLVWSGLDSLGLTLLIVSTLIFYVGGILLRNNETFKRVSIVFVGTGMAMLPFIGVLLYNITKISPEIIWLVLSLIGTPVYFFAAYIMKNQVLAFIAMAGLISLSCSMPSAMNLGLVWYFVFVMILGIILDLIDKTKISERLGVMSSVLRVTGEWLPLAALVMAGTVLYQLSATDFGILFSIIIVQFTLNLWQRQNLLWETLLRLAIFITIILLSYIIMPTNTAIGIGLIIATSLEFIYSLLSMLSLRKDFVDKDRITMEVFWTILALIVYPVSCLFITNFTFLGEHWYYLLAALVIDTVIMVGSSFLFKTRDWFFGLILVGLLLPTVIANLLNIPNADSSVFYISFNLAEMYILAGLSWLMEDDQKGNSMALASAVVFGLSCLVMSHNNLVSAGILVLIALVLGARGWNKKFIPLLETAVYIVATSAMMVISYAMEDIIRSDLTFSQLLFVIMGHIAFISLVITSVLWDNKGYRIRLMIGTIGLLIVMGGLALGGAVWIMIMFMVEAATILVVGIICKQLAVWISGAIGLFAGVMWFTKDLYFVWPVVLGVGLIGAVVGIIIYNDRKSKRLGK